MSDAKETVESRRTSEESERVEGVALGERQHKSEGRERKMNEE